MPEDIAGQFDAWDAMEDADLLQLHREFKRGDQLALNKAIIYCFRNRRPLDHWMQNALWGKLDGEMQKSRAGRRWMVQQKRKLARPHVVGGRLITYEHFRDLGFGAEIAETIAAKLLRIGRETLHHSCTAVRRQSHAEQVPEYRRKTGERPAGFENMRLDDMLGCPEDADARMLDVILQTLSEEGAENRPK